ncbi:MAG: peptide deformylase [Chloroflexota bacterium]
MSVKKILTISKHEKILKTPSEPAKRIGKDIKQLIQDIKDTIDANPAVGLAAPQIGVLKRVFGARLGYYDDQKDDDMAPPTIFINPEIVEQSEAVERGFDACLSIPGMFGYTDRNLKIKIRYLDEAGKKVERDLEGWDARVFQHELDHLDGILFLQRLPLEDLYVYVTDEEGNREPVPYLEIVNQASGPAESTKLPSTSANKPGNRSLSEREQ